MVARLTSFGLSLAPGRFARAARLDPTLFREVRKDPSAIASGAAVVILGGVAHSLGNWSAGGVAGLFVSTSLALLVWLFAGGTVRLLSRYVAPQATPLVAILRTCAFAAAPVTLLALGIAPLPGWARTGLWLCAHLAMTIAFVIAVREALGIDTTRALFLSLATLLIGLLALFLLGLVFVPSAAI